MISRRKTLKRTPSERKQKLERAEKIFSLGLQNAERKAELICSSLYIEMKLNLPRKNITEGFSAVFARLQKRERG
jgi:hypothetical protein